MKRRTIVAALSLVIGAGITGSITSTIAWYQYSLKTNASYIGASGGTSENLLMRIKKDGQAANQGWTSRLSASQIGDYLATAGYGSNMAPITTGSMDKTAALNGFYGNPIASFKDESSWQAATKANYVVIPLELCYNKKNGQDGAFLAKDVYLSNLRIAQLANDTHEDISDAIRVHFSSSYYTDGTPLTYVINNFLASKKGGTTDTHGYLDLDADPGLDYAYPENDPYGSNGSAKQYIDYGSGQQVAFSAEEDLRSGTYYDYQDNIGLDQNVYPLVVGHDDTNKAKLAKLEYATGQSKCLGRTFDSSTSFLNINITIWIEGWQKLAQGVDANNQPTGYNAIWDVEKFVASEYEVGFEFAVDAE